MYTISRGFAIQGMRRFPFVLDRFKLRLKLYLDKRVLEPLETQLARTFVVAIVVVVGVGCRVESRREACVRVVCERSRVVTVG